MTATSAAIDGPVWLTGARGMLGRELLAQLEAVGIEVIASGSEADVADRGQLLAALGGRRPRVVINAAAYTAVDRAESEPERAFATNALGAGNVASIARELGADLIHVSTDYVLDGPFGVPLAEDAPVAPRGVYAESKRAGELAVLASADDARRVIVLRTSWLFADHPRSFVTRMLAKIAAEPELEVVADQHGKPTAAGDLAAVIASSTTGELPVESGVLHFASPGITTWHGFACEIREAALRHSLPVATRGIHPVTTADYPRPAPRPSWSVLDCARIEASLAARGTPARPWREALDALVATLARARL